MNISIIITTYNAAAYIIDTLHSILNQTYQNFEIIIVDDGSVDNTVELCRDYIVNNALTNLHLFPIEHLGRSAALNYGVNHAQHNWIAIIDADDLWNKHKLECQVKCIMDKKLDFIAARSQLFTRNDEVNINENIKSNINAMRLTPVSLSKMLYFNLISHSSVLMKKDLAHYSLQRRSQVDYELFLRILSQGVSIYLLEECLVYHRIHPGQSFEGKNNLRYYLNATTLQLKYCFLRFKLLQAFFVVGKLGYYLLPKKLRFSLRTVLLNNDSFNKS